MLHFIIQYVMIVFPLYYSEQLLALLTLQVFSLSRIHTCTHTRMVCTAAVNHYATSQLTEIYFYFDVH